MSLNWTQDGHQRIAGLSGLAKPEVQLIDLLRDAQRGDTEASEQFFLSIRPYAIHVASTHVGSLPASVVAPEDIAQEALYRAFRSLETCRATSSGEVYCWLRTITRHIAIEMMRAHSHRVARQCVEITEACEAVGDRDFGRVNDLAAPRAATQRWVFDAYEELSDESAQVLYLHLVSACGWDEVGREMGITSTAAKRRYQRAQASIRSNVERRSAAHLAAASHAMSDISEPGNSDVETR